MSSLNIQDLLMTYVCSSCEPCSNDIVVTAAYCLESIFNDTSGSFALHCLLIHVESINSLSSIINHCLKNPVKHVFISIEVIDIPLITDKLLLL